MSGFGSVRSVVGWGLLLLVLSGAPATLGQDFVWVRQLAGADDVVARDVALDSSGNVCTVGLFDLTVDFDPGPGTANLTAADTDAFVSMLDSAGNFVWARKLGGSDADGALRVTLDGTGNVYTVGFFLGTADFDPGPGMANLTAAGLTGLSDGFVSKLNSAGNYVWARRLGGPEFDTARGVAVDGNGNVYTAGHFLGTADFDPGPGAADLTSLGLSDVFVSKLDSAGDFVWVRQFGGTDFVTADRVMLDDAGNVYTVGAFRGTVDFDPGAGTTNLTSAGWDDVFVTKLDGAGNFSWARGLGGTMISDAPRSVAVDGSGNVYTVGQFHGTADFDPGPGTHNLSAAGGGYDAFVSKLSAAGSFLWAHQLGGTDFDIALAVGLDGDGSVVTVGRFESTADFDPGTGTANLTPVASADAFVWKLDSAGDFVWAGQLGGMDVISAEGLALDDEGNIYTVGYFYETADFDPGPGTANLGADIRDSFVLRLGPRLLLGVEPEQLAWGPPGNAVAYDIVRGDLTALRSSMGDFAQATDECLTNDRLSGTLPYVLSPGPGEGQWFLVRRVSDNGSTTYDTGAYSQVGLRDAEIAASGVDCP